MKEGWGLAKYMLNNKDVFLATDGSSKIFTIDPSNWKVIETHEVFNKILSKII